MAVYAYGCSDFEGLVRELVRQVDDSRAECGLVDGWSRPATIVVPSLDMGEYTRQVVAYLTGVAVNYRFSTLQKFMGEAL